MVTARIKEIGPQQKLVADLKKEIAEHKKLLAERTKVENGDVRAERS